MTREKALSAVWVAGGSTGPALRNIPLVFLLWRRGSVRWRPEGSSTSRRAAWKNHAFIFADGRLVVELKDPAPELLDDCGRFGLGTYASRIQFANLKVYRPYWEPTHFRYPEPDWE